MFTSFYFSISSHEELSLVRYLTLVDIQYKVLPIFDFLVYPYN